MNWKHSVQVCLLCHSFRASASLCAVRAASPRFWEHRVMPAPVVLGVLLLVFPECLLGYKVLSNEAKTASFCQQQPTRSSPVECADVLQEVTCDTTWSSACPGLENPLGSEFNDAKISVLCEDLCTQKAGLGVVYSFLHVCAHCSPSERQRERDKDQHQRGP